MTLIGPGTTYPDEDAQQARNDQACIDARKKAGIPNPEDFDHGCEENCRLHETKDCPFPRRDLEELENIVREDRADRIAQDKREAL